MKSKTPYFSCVFICCVYFDVKTMIELYIRGGGLLGMGGGQHTKPMCNDVD